MTRPSPQEAAQGWGGVSAGCEGGRDGSGAGGGSADLRMVMDKRMLSGLAFDSHDIIAISERNGGTWRQADAAIQRLRRSGKIQFYRDGRRVIWRMVP